MLFFACGDIAPFVKSAKAAGSLIIVQCTCAEDALDAKNKGITDAFYLSFRFFFILLLLFLFINFVSFFLSAPILESN